MQQTKVLTTLYGENRDVVNDDGGFVLCVEQGTEPENIKALFDYSVYIPEYVNVDRNLFLQYILNNEYVVVIVMSLDDAPYEFRKEINNEKI